MERIETIRGIDIPEKVSGWVDQFIKPNDLGFMSYIQDRVDASDIVVFSKVLFPEFFIFDDVVFLSDFVDEDMVRARFPQCKAKGKDERSFNLVKIWDLFPWGAEERSYEDAGKIIAFAWDVSLRRTFPDRNFCVEYINSEQNYGPIVSFHQVFDHGKAPSELDAGP
ncbi:hypothetical protein HW511_08200 [Asaia siamensis]|uniref:Uncharacterized protein n=1 Tax=Asaia siamensis TaxID=110479 RepID=A0ABQ1LSW2_9PROT|nr:hypothetical protein [Asaia siamensis]GBR03419.1 hypothetical protein AA0323_0298 [Asaia siamensis NRIC 0323]GGC29267.1 hypothetical protein GCM10007207_13420 [Asaia siamensis]